MKIVTASQMQAIDKRAIEEVGIPGIVLMERAGSAVARAIEEAFEGAKDLKVAIFCGRGNNGGDGFVVARNLRNKGALVHIFLLADPSNIAGDALINFNILKKMGQEFHLISQFNDLKQKEDLIKEADLIVDAIFGTGLSSPVRGVYQEVIEFLNHSGKAIVAVDIPSGLSADLAHPIGKNVKANITVTFGLPKIGNFLYPARNDVGELIVADIGIPPFIIEEAEIQLETIEKERVKEVFKEREPTAFKNNFGHILIIAGSAGFTGAAYLASQSAAIMGAGLVTLAIPQSLNDIMEVKLTEVMTLPVPETKERTFSLSAFDPILAFSRKASAIALGPGISTHPETREFVYKVVENIHLPMVIDADGLNLLAGNLDVIAKRWDKMEPEEAPLVLTPHPGEMARLAGILTSQVQENRIETARTFAEEYSVIVVLKGAQTLIARPDGNVSINTTGNPYMATGGVGDVLTGMIVGLLGQGFSASLSAEAAVFLHGYAADLAVEDKKLQAILATEIFEYLPKAINSLIKEEEVED